MASLSPQLRWPAPAAISSPGGQAIAADSRKDPWTSLTSSPSTTPAKRPPSSPWDDMGLKRPMFGMVSSPGSDIWANDNPSPLFGPLSPSPSVTSASDSPKIALSPKPFTLSEVSAFSTAVHKVSAQHSEIILDARDDPFHIQHRSPSSLPFANRSAKNIPEPEIISLAPMFAKAGPTSPVISSINTAPTSPLISASKSPSISASKSPVVSSVRAASISPLISRVASISPAASGVKSASRSPTIISSVKSAPTSPSVSGIASTSVLLAVSGAKAAADGEDSSDCSYSTNELWATDQNDNSNCDESYPCVDSEEQLLKTELCRNWGPPLYHCQYGDTCNFAHGEAELRERIRRGEYKSKLCDEPVRLGVRSCTYTTQQQSRCNYCHPGEALRRKCSRPYFDSEYFAILTKEFPDNSYPFGIFI